MAKKDEQVITLNPIKIQYATLTIEGDGDLVLNKMNARTVRDLTNQRKDKAKVIDKANPYEDIITSIHWRDALPTTDYHDWDEDTLREMLANNAPCITAFGLKKSFNQAVVRNEIDTYATKFDNSLNVIAENNLIPVTFASHTVEERLMSPKRGAPVLVRINLFHGWKAEFQISYMDTVYSLEQIVDIVNRAGFGLGIGSGRSSGYGRYHVTGVKA